MFGTNEIVGQKFFNAGALQSLLVTSMFHTIQGEGIYAGQSAIFIRLAKCNLACSFCDTFFDAGDWLSFGQIDEKIQGLLSEFPADRLKKIGIVLTGGEPLLQAKISDFLYQIRDKVAWVQIESNGTVEQHLDYSTTLIISPKCVEKNGCALNYLKPAAWMLNRADALKFVMRAPSIDAEKFDPYTEVPRWGFDWAEKTNKPVFVSPMNVYNSIPAKAKAIRLVAKEALLNPDFNMRSTIDEVVSFWEPGLLDTTQNQRNHEYTAGYCLKHNLRLNLQMHLYAGLP